MSDLDRYRRSPRVLWRRVGTDVYLTDRSSPDIELLAGGAAATWLVMDEEMSLTEIVRSVADVFDVDVTRVRRQIEGFLGELERRDRLICRR